MALIVRHNVSAIPGVDSILHYGRPRPGREGFISLLAGDKLDTAALVDRDFRIIKQKSHEDKSVYEHTFDLTITFKKSPIVASKSIFHNILQKRFAKGDKINSKLHKKSI